MQTIRLNRAAERFKAHPRTILRALSDEVNVFWNEEFNPLIEVTMLANSYSMNETVLIRVLRGKDDLLKPGEAASKLKVPARTFRWRKYHAAARKGGIVRYAYSQLVNEHMSRWDEHGTFLD